MASTPGTELPPRSRRPSEVASIKRNESSLDVLMQMGFSRQRAEKAIAATGDRGVHLASDWLLSHHNDPEIDSEMQREYVLYLCPVKDLHTQLDTFYNKSLKQCGRNGAHSYFPHITLCKFYKAADGMVLQQVHSLRTVADRYKNKLGSIKLELFTSPNFIGLFVGEEDALVVKQMVASFAAELSTYGIDVEPHKKQLHITLAYQYPGEQQEKLQQFANDINLASTSRWDLRLYSRETRVAKRAVQKVTFPHKPNLPDELELILGDFIHMDPVEATTSEDGWHSGTSWLTGITGMFPGNFTEQVAETQTWTLHRSTPIIDGDLSTITEDGADASSLGAVAGGSSSFVRNGTVSDIPQYAQVKKKADRGSQNAGAHKSCPRTLYIVRHGERVDFTFGRDWLETYFDMDGNYIRADLNLPKTLIKRKGGKHAYIKDAPLTELGHFQARRTGEALGEKGVMIAHMYASPSLRCVQTATEILKGLGLDLPIRLEPGLFEWLGWYKLGMPKWMTPQEYKEAGFNIDTSYKPFQQISKYNMEENTDQYYGRCHDITSKVLNLHEKAGGDVMLVAHAGSLDTHSRQLLGAPPRPMPEFVDIVRQISYCAVATVQEQLDKEKQPWKLVEPPIASMTLTANSKYQWTVLRVPKTT